MDHRIFCRFREDRETHRRNKNRLREMYRPFWSRKVEKRTGNCFSIDLWISQVYSQFNSHFFYFYENNKRHHNIGDLLSYRHHINAVQLCILLLLILHVFMYAYILYYYYKNTFTWQIAAPKGWNTWFRVYFIILLYFFLNVEIIKYSKSIVFPENAIHMW